uniref:SWIM-type domain-containing protein n=1 Tax=Plectus sambesii TaxID=2011161 RepID=A0A914WGT5_9BILA
MTRRMSEDHSRGYYLTQCRDLIEEKTAGREWAVQSSDGYCGKQYTVTREAVAPCATTCCTQCHACPHQYTCTCPRYEQDDVMSCKHTHAINKMVFLKQFAIVKEEVEAVVKENIKNEAVKVPKQEAPIQAPSCVQEPEVEVVEADDGDYPDFSEPIRFRRFQLRVKGPNSVSSLFINAHALGDLSPLLADLCFDGDFVEKQQVMVEDESHKDLLELMRCVFPCSLTTFQCKPISIHNVALLSRLAHKYQIAQLKSHCEKFLTTEFSCKRVGPGVVLKILMAVAKTDFSKEAIATIIGRAATYDLQTLNQANLAENLPAKVWSVLLETKKHYRPSQGRILMERRGHQFEVGYNRMPVAHESYSWDRGTRDYMSNCLNCAKSFCLDNYYDEDEASNEDDDSFMEKCSKPENVPLPAARVNIALLN